MNNRNILLFSGLAMLSACGEPRLPPGQYKLGLHDAYERLAKGDFNDFKFERHCGILINIATQRQGERAVTWHVTSSGRRMLSFTATLTPVDDKTTKVEVSISREANGREAYDGTQQYPRPALNQPVRPAIEEKIASLLTGRPYEAKRMSKEYSSDGACTLQRNGLEAGIACFTVDDRPGMSAIEMMCRR
jgi:hypothetical protein